MGRRIIHQQGKQKPKKKLVSSEESFPCVAARVSRFHRRVDERRAREGARKDASGTRITSQPRAGQRSHSHSLKKKYLYTNNDQSSSRRHVSRDSRDSRPPTGIEVYYFTVRQGKHARGEGGRDGRGMVHSLGNTAESFQSNLGEVQLHRRRLRLHVGVRLLGRVGEEVELRALGRRHLSAFGISVSRRLHELARFSRGAE